MKATGVTETVQEGVTPGKAEAAEQEDETPSKAEAAEQEDETPSKAEAAAEGTPGKSKEKEEPTTPERKLEEEVELLKPTEQEQKDEGRAGDEGRGRQDEEKDISMTDKSVDGGKAERGAEGGEKDDGDEVVFAAEVELFHDKDNNWENKGRGPIKIVISGKGATHWVRMKVGERFVADHPIKKVTQLVLAKRDDRCYVWTTEDSSSGGRPEKTTFLARFKSSDSANSFRESFEQGQTGKKKKTPGKKKKTKGEDDESSLGIGGQLSLRLE